ncbi:MAG: RNA polymerase sigma factor [Nocardioides sp.]
MRTSLHHPEVFAEIFDRHAPAIHRYLSRRVGDLSDDLLSETFLTAFRKRGDYRADRVDVRPWLFGIGANLIRRHHREEVARYRALSRSVTTHGVCEFGSADDFEVAVDRADAQSLGPRLAAALSDLETRDREVLLLVAWGDLAYAEVAAVLEVPVGTVRSRLHRARRQLRAYLAPATSGRRTGTGDRIPAQQFPVLITPEPHLES